MPMWLAPWLLACMFTDLLSVVLLRAISNVLSELFSGLPNSFRGGFQVRVGQVSLVLNVVVGAQGAFEDCLRLQTALLVTSGPPSVFFNPGRLQLHFNKRSGKHFQRTSVRSALHGSVCTWLHVLLRHSYPERLRRAQQDEEAQPHVGANGSL